MTEIYRLRLDHYIDDGEKRHQSPRVSSRIWIRRKMSSCNETVNKGGSKDLPLYFYTIFTLLFPNRKETLWTF